MSADLVLAASLSLARNDAETPFPHVAGADRLSGLLERVGDALSAVAGPGEWQIDDLDAVSPVKRAYLVERGLMTPSFSRARGKGRGYALYRGGAVALEVNGSEHLRLLATTRSGGLADLWDTVDPVDDELEAALTYAFDEEWGYLTSRPSQAGTGLSAHVTVHVPALMISGSLGGVAMDLVGRGLALVPLWEGAGGVFQVSNKDGGGTPEEVVIEAVETAAREVVEREQTMRRVFLMEDPVRVRDHIGRSVGIAGHSWSVSAHEAVSLVSAIRAGVSMGVVDAPGFTQQEAFSLMLKVLPGHIAVEEQGAGHDGLDDPRSDEIRARILRETFAGVRVVE